MTDDVPYKRRGRPPKQEPVPTADEHDEFVFELLRRPIAGEREATKLKPTLDILKIIGELAKRLASKNEIASILGVTPDIFSAFLSDCEPARLVYERGLDNGRINVRMGQLDLAKKQANMAMFLGKNYLGQKDESHTTYNNASKPAKELTEEDLLEIAMRNTPSTVIPLQKAKGK
jgi:predicted transcriptional regulator